jgi:toxin ParE1/3/4
MIDRLLIRPEAEQDMVDGRDWYESQRQGLGADFLMAIDEMLGAILATPQLVPAEYRSVRRVRLSHFPYVVYYRVLVDHLEVVAVLHGSRDPREWQARA